MRALSLPSFTFILVAVVIFAPPYTNAARIAISNDDDYADASFETKESACALCRHIVLDAGAAFDSNSCHRACLSAAAASRRDAASDLGLGTADVCARMCSRIHSRSTMSTSRFVCAHAGFCRYTNEMRRLDHIGSATEHARLRVHDAKQGSKKDRILHVNKHDEL